MGQVEQLLGELAPARSPASKTPESEAWREFQLFEFNTAPAPVEQSWRARSVREINRIAVHNQWGDEVAAWLDRWEAYSLADLADEPLGQLLERMRHLQDCLHNGGFSPDAPHAS
ncbi:hypothetical protein [Pseudoxanthomonas winnipegensis]|uniref:hypothetical protein n=1 Tax=Pseudoxanthomonas winnipegensis TaxID=2480810 RepID=UPI00103E2F42|nr:hypothetical protein [Pseudoxanthomonas winnipegensis]TBV76836.1 hypothetical protein EYC45_01340 [Pseudoxanthomonas winnipegensis]